MATIPSTPVNSSRATGPKTPAGKNVSRYNRLSHGLTSDAPVVPGESAEDWNTYRTGILDSLRPVGPLEAELADRVASLLWRLRRVTRYETAATTAAIDHALGNLTGEYHPADPTDGTFAPPYRHTSTAQSVASRRGELAGEQDDLADLRDARAVLDDLTRSADDHQPLAPDAGFVLHQICEHECRRSLDDPVLTGDLPRPHPGWEPGLGAEGWTVGMGRQVVDRVGRRIGRTRELVLARAGRRIDDRITIQEAVVRGAAADLARAERDLAAAAERAQEVNLLPADSTERVIRYEAHLSRQLKTTYQLLAQAQAVRVRNGSSEEVVATGQDGAGSKPGATSPDRTPAEAAQHAPEAAQRPPERAVEAAQHAPERAVEAPSAGPEPVFTDRTPTGATISPPAVVFTDRTPITAIDPTGISASTTAIPTASGFPRPGDPGNDRGAGGWPVPQGGRVANPHLPLGKTG